MANIQMKHTLGICCCITTFKIERLITIIIFLYHMNLWVWNLSNAQMADSSGPHVISQGPLVVFSLQLGWYGRTKVTSLTSVLLQQ